jgi:uncharacterized protein (TIGR03437 family)
LLDFCFNICPAARFVARVVYNTVVLGGTTVTVTVGSVIETCIMFYTLSTQVAAVLPSATPVGSGTLTVTFQAQSASMLSRF